MSGEKARAINRAWEQWPNIDPETVAEMVAAGWDAAKAASSKRLDPVTPWLGGHCKHPTLNHEDCPGKSFRRPCICPCHESPAPVSESTAHPKGTP